MHLRAVSLHQQMGGHPGAPGEDLLQPGDPREAPLICPVDHIHG